MFGMYFVTVLFVSVFYKTRCTSNIQSFDVLADTMDDDVVSVSIICVNLKDYHNQ